MKTLQFPSGWFNQTSFERLNGILPKRERSLLTKLSQNGSVEVRVVPKGGRLFRLYRRVGSVGEVRDRIYSPKILRELFSAMGLVEMPVLTNETQPV